MTYATHHYNPDWLDDDSLVSGFIARQGDFQFLRDELARAPLVGTVQHHLVVGQRGAGKTTLLKRLAVAIRRDPELSDHLIALSFPEELYQVKNLDDFWWAACEALGDELQRGQETAAAAQIFEAIDSPRPREGSGEIESVGLAQLLDTCAALRRRPVMLIDNFDFVVRRIEQGGRSKHKGPPSTTYWALREALSTASSPIVIGGAVTLSEPFTHYDKAFYDFFMPMRLGRLSMADVRRLLEALADRQGVPEVKTRIAERPARIETLNELTGGNPRAVGLVFELLRQGPNGSAVSDFERLMDLTTPYYKARFEDLADQAQIVMHALAVHKRTDTKGLQFGHTASAIASRTGLPTNTISAQLEVLVREGLVEKSPASGRTQYRISEQLFRLWLQMRGTQRVRQNVIGLAEFLEAWFDFKEMTAHLGSATGRSGALLTFAVGETREGASMQHGLAAHGAQLILAQSPSEDLASHFAPGDLPEDVAFLVKLRHQLRHSGVANRSHGDQQTVNRLSADEQTAWLGAVRVNLGQKRASVDRLCDRATAASEAAAVRAMLAAERAWLLGGGLSEGDASLLLELRAQGHLPLPNLLPSDVEAAAMTHQRSVRPMVWRLLGVPGAVHISDDAVAGDWLKWGFKYAIEATAVEWARVAGSLRGGGHLKSAAQALEESFERGESSEAWSQRGVLYEHMEGDTVRAEAAFRRSIELAPTDARPWNNLGILLTSLPDREKEAEEALRKAIRLDDSNAKAWNSLGSLLANDPGRLEKAEDAFLRAVELDPNLHGAWNNLGILLADGLSRPEEAATAFRRAIELDRTDDMPWGNLGFLYEDSDRLDDAIAAFDCALALCDPKDPNRKHWQMARNRTATAKLARSVLGGLRSGDETAVRAALTEFLTRSDAVLEILAGDVFLDRLLVPALATADQAQTLLRILLDLGFDKIARPLLMAFEAAVLREPKSLDSLEPEVRDVAKRIHSALAAGST